jgi:hypothetical protein
MSAAQPSAVQKLAWLGTNTNGPAGASISHCNTTYQTNMEDIRWFGGNSDDYMTANAISFGSDLQMNSVTLSASCSPKLGMAWHQ